MRSTKVPSSLEPRLNVLLQDISSLINHTNFCFERLEYLQDTVLGLINLDQNKIMKVLAVVSLFMMPPTLIAGFYGMNVRLPMIAADEPNASFWNWIIILGIMALSTLLRRRAFFAPPRGTKNNVKQLVSFHKKLCLKKSRTWQKRLR